MSANHLHQLIKSLSAPEKGYIKKHAMLHVIGSQNKYIKIFDAIDKQKVYDEKEIIRKFKGEPTLNNFAVAKNYLFKFILKSLESYNTNVKSEELLEITEYLGTAHTSYAKRFLELIQQAREEV